MKFVRKGSTLYIDKQLLDNDDLLDRLQKEISKALRLELSDFTRTKKRFNRELLAISLPSKEAAEAAEIWVDKEFEA